MEGDVESSLILGGSKLMSRIQYTEIAMGMSPDSNIEHTSFQIW